VEVFWKVRVAVLTRRNLSITTFSATVRLEAIAMVLRFVCESVSYTTRRTGPAVLGLSVGKIRENTCVAEDNVLRHWRTDVLVQRDINQRIRTQAEFTSVLVLGFWYDPLSAAEILSTLNVAAFAAGANDAANIAAATKWCVHSGYSREQIERSMARINGMRRWMGRET
jgi:hypothetical protein